MPFEVNAWIILGSSSMEMASLCCSQQRATKSYQACFVGSLYVQDVLQSSWVEIASTPRHDTLAKVAPQNLHMKCILRWVVCEHRSARGREPQQRHA